MSQEELFAAEGGYIALGAQMGLAFGGIGLACMFNPRLVNYFRNGQLRFTDWATLGALSGGSYFVGGIAGPMAFGDNQKVTNHWLAYTFVKEQNRIMGRRSLANTTSY